MFKVREILVPVDFSDHSHKALNYALELALSNDARLHIIHVIEPPVYPATWSYAQVGLVESEKELCEAAERELEELRQKYCDRCPNIVTKTIVGQSAADEINHYAAEHKIDMISIATHGRRGLERFLFGSTTERVLRTAPCPVLAVRTPPHHGELDKKENESAD